MECEEVLAWAGRGWWGNHHTDVALSTLQRTWHARAGVGVARQEAFRLSYELLDSVPPHRSFREFDSAAERQVFFERALSRVEERAESAYVLHGCTPRFKNWPGLFVRDVDVEYGLRMTIGDEHVVIEDEPDLRSAGATLAADSAGYAAAVRALVGERIVGADVYLDDGFVLSFPWVELVLSTERMHRYQWPFEIEEAIGGGVIPPRSSSDIRER